MSQLNVTGVMKLLATHLKLWIGNKNWFRKKNILFTLQSLSNKTTW
jgi:hypothetical protein